jgi:Endosomal/lysosomal potassium channel TMEM175
MPSLYNRVAGQSAERLAALSDGIFAVAMTPHVLDLRVPGAEAVHSERDLWHILLALAPRLLIFLMSVMTLRPQSLLDSHRFLLRRGAGTVLHLAACGIYPLSRRTFGLLVQHPPARSGEYFPAGPSEES